MRRSRDDTDTYHELFTVGQGFVHVLDRPLLAPSRRQRTLRLWLAAAAVWTVAAMALALLVGLLVTRSPGEAGGSLASEEIVLPMAAGVR